MAALSHKQPDPNRNTPVTTSARTYTTLRDTIVQTALIRPTRRCPPATSFGWSMSAFHAKYEKDLHNGRMYSGP